MDQNNYSVRDVVIEVFAEATGISADKLTDDLVFTPTKGRSFAISAPVHCANLPDMHANITTISAFDLVKASTAMFPANLAIIYALNSKQETTFGDIVKHAESLHDPAADMCA